MFLSPTAITDTEWATMTVVGGSVAMIMLFIYVFDYLSKNSTIGQGLARYVLLLMAAYAMMMAGLFVWMVNGDGLLFAVSVIVEMLVYLSLVLNRVERQSPKAWRGDAWWTVELLSLLFVAEFFMGAVLEVQVNGVESFFSAMGFAPLTGGPLVVVGAGLYDFVLFFGAVTSSPWFLIMMGVEMGVLVAFKARLARELETKVRLVLVIVAYAVYSILLQNFLIPASLLPHIPFVGWSMGVGTSGPVAPMLLVGLIGTYLISGVLSFLFGSRQVCSMFCAAALMYQGTFYDSMKTFNRTSKIGRKYLTSKLSNLYKLTFSAVWVSIISAAAISYLDSLGILSVSIFGADPARFTCTFYFGFLWYIVFITIPFVGTYGCVSMGWCHWGTFNQLVGRLGLFKLKVRDPVRCVECTTKDCARACPVGLTALPASFISKGEFKSSRCIGVGDCVDACPYNNEYFYDVRSWVRQRLARLLIDGSKI
jgi:polyferredoxin